MKKVNQKIDELLSEIIEKATELKKLMIDEDSNEEVKAEPEVKKLTLEDVRKVLTEKSRAGKTADVKALLKKHNSNKLSEVNPDEYAELLKEAEVI